MKSLVKKTKNRKGVADFSATSRSSSSLVIRWQAPNVFAGRVLKNQEWSVKEEYASTGREFDINQRDSSTTDCARRELQPCRFMVKWVPLAWVNDSIHVEGVEDTIAIDQTVQNRHSFVPFTYAK